MGSSGRSALRADAAAGRNVMPALMQAVKSYASVGEMTKALVEVYGRFKEPTQLWRRWRDLQGKSRRRFME